MTSWESSLRPVCPWQSRTLFWVVLALLGGSLLSWVAFDREAISWVLRSKVDLDANFWVDVLTWLGKAWLQVWLLLIWFTFSRRRREVLAGILALVIVAVTVNPLKAVVGRVRPYSIVKAQEAGRPEHDVRNHLSFPSGDAAAAFAVAGAVAPTVGWPLRVVLLGSSAAVAFLRVTALAHYPSDVLAGAAMGLLAGWLALRLIDRWGCAERPFLFERGLVLGGTIGIPAIRSISGGLTELLVLLKTYGMLALSIAGAAKINEVVRRGRCDRLLSWLTKARFAAVFLAFAVVLVKNVVEAEKPRELLPWEVSASPWALLGFTLVLAGAALRLWAQENADRTGALARGPYAIISYPLHVGAFLVVSGLLLQLNDRANWFVVLPIFILFYGASLVREERILEGSFGEHWRSYRVSVPALVPSLRSLSSLRPPRSWDWRIRTSTPAIWMALLLISLPVLIELLIEDFLFESVLGM